MKRIILYINMLLISTTFANANTVDEIMESIKTNNFSLKASEEATKSSIQTIKSTNSLNDPQVGFEYHEGANVDGNKYGLSVSQSFSWPGLYITRSKANKLKISIEESNLLAKRLDVLLNAKQLCIQIINYNKKINSQTAVYENISQLYTEYEKGYKHGEISILDINKLKIELLNTKRVLDEFSAQRTILIEELCALNGNKSIDFICNITDYPVQTIESIDTYLAQISTLDPEYLASKQNVDAKSKDISISKMGWLPEFSLGYNYSNEMGTKFNGVSVGISIPIFSNKNKVGASKAEFTSAEMSQKDILINKEQSLKAIYAHAVTINYQIHSYKNVLDNGSNQEMLKKALNGGQISLLDYLLELRYFLEAQQTLLDLEFEYNTQLTDLNKYNLL